MQKLLTRLVAVGLIVSVGAANVRAQEPVEHLDQMIMVSNIYKGAKKALSLQESLVTGALVLNNMLGGAGRYLSPFLVLGDVVTGNKYKLISTKKLTLGVLADEVGLMNYKTASTVMDKSMLFSRGMEYTDAQIAAVKKNQVTALNDLAVTNMAFANSMKASASEHGAEAVDLEAITKSVDGAQDLQQVFQVLTASDRQILSNMLSLGATEASIGMLAATKALEGISGSPSTSADTGVKKEGTTDAISGVVADVADDAGNVVNEAQSAVGGLNGLVDSAVDRVNTTVDNTVNAAKGA